MPRLNAEKILTRQESLRRYVADKLGVDPVRVQVQVSVISLEGERDTVADRSLGMPDDAVERVVGLTRQHWVRRQGGDVTLACVRKLTESEVEASDAPVS